MDRFTRQALRAMGFWFGVMGLMVYLSFMGAPEWTFWVLGFGSMALMVGWFLWYYKTAFTTPMANPDPMLVHRLQQACERANIYNLRPDVTEEGYDFRWARGQLYVGQHIAGLLNDAQLQARLHLFALAEPRPKRPGRKAVSWLLLAFSVLVWYANPYLAAIPFLAGVALQYMIMFRPDPEPETQPSPLHRFLEQGGDRVAYFQSAMIINQEYMRMKAARGGGIRPWDMVTLWAPLEQSGLAAGFRPEELYAMAQEVAPAFAAWGPVWHDWDRYHGYLERIRHRRWGERID